MSNDPPKRTESAEITIVSATSPRSSLPPMSTRPATIDDLADLERARRDDLDDRAVDVERARREAQERDTLQPCPWCSNGMVSHEQREAWLEKYPELAAEQPPPSQSDPDSEPPPRAA